MAYGLDFYANANDGIIPQDSVLRNNGKPIIFDSDKVYLPGYVAQEKIIISHIGGTQDVALLLKYMKDYPIYCDEYMKKILDDHNGLEPKPKRRLAL